MCWKPFDVRFSQFLQDYTKHVKILEQELALEHATKVFKEFDLLKERFYETNKSIQELGSKDTSENQNQGFNQEETLAGEFS